MLPRERGVTDLRPRRPTQETEEPVVYETYRPLRSSGLRLIRLVWFLAGLVDSLIGIRFALKLLGASTQAPFVNLVYGITSPLISPFRLIFPTAGHGPFVLEPESLVALIIYPLIGLGAVSLIRIMDKRQTLPS
jgi:uncharacterized protein YggT (Ycf19 family)